MSALRNRKRDDAVSRATRTDCLMAADPGLVVREGLEALEELRDEHEEHDA